jgi:8-amino-7-oxononanoate synthase
MPSETPIQPLLCGDESTVMALSATLEQSGFLVSAIRPPTVPEGKARLRVTLSALHAPAQVRALVDAIAHARDTVVQPPSLTALTA